jgi:hypothetical protein
MINLNVVAHVTLPRRQGFDGIPSLGAGQWRASKSTAKLKDSREALLFASQGKRVDSY